MKIKIPEGMLKAAMDAYCDTSCPQRMFPDYLIEAALAWLAEHPIVPSEEQSFEMAKMKAGFPFDAYEWVRWGAVEWQRRMFCEPEVPKAIKDLLEWDCDWGSNYLKGYILEAYRRGLTARDEHCREGSTGTSKPAPATPSAAWADSRKRR